MIETISILIADDHAPFRDGLRALLDASPKTTIVGESSTGRETVELAGRLQPDVILMDIQMPDLNGIEATREILSTSPHIAVVVLTMFEDDDFVLSAMKAGARGYLLKGAMKAEILRAIESVASGEAVFGPAIARRLMTFFADLHRPGNVPTFAFPELSGREREILALMADHKANDDIARTLNISLKTVRNHVSNIFSKLQVVDRAQAILRAREAGLGNGS